VRSLIAALATTIAALALAACGGTSHPAPPPPPPEFDAKRLAAQLDAVMGELETTSRTYEKDCAKMVAELARVEDRARGPIEHAHAAQRDPDHAKQLTAELRAYNEAAAGRSELIAMRLAICFKQHGELQHDVQRVVDSMPTP
jgi:hypothetical protein